MTETDFNKLAEYPTSINGHDLRTDQDRADEWRKLIGYQLGVLCGELERASSDGFQVEFTLGRDQIGRWSVARLVISKHF